MSHNSSAPPPSLSPTASRHREWKLGCKVYVGNLVDGASKSDIEEAFNKYGPLRSVWVARNPSGFAFVEFEDGRDAEDACRHLDGTRIAGGRIKAEMSHGRTRRGRGGGGSGGPPSFRAGPPPFHSPYPMNGHSYHGHPFRGPYQGPPPPRGGAGYYSNGDYHDSYVNSHHHPSLPPPRHHSHSNHSHHNNNHHHHHSSHHSGSSGYRGPPPPSEPPMHHGYSERLSRHVPKPRSPLGGKDAYRYSRSRSNSLGKSPPPPPPQPPTQPTSQHQQEQQEQLQPSPLAQSQPPGSASPPSPSARTAQPRTPPSESDF